MKQMILISMVCMILLSSAVLASVSLDVSWSTAVSTLRPGAATTIDLVISNTGTTSLTNVVIKSSGGPDLSVTSGQIELGGLLASGTAQGSITVKADEDAISRTSYVNLIVDYYTGTSQYSKTFTIPITIKRAPILQIVNVKYNDTISPGKTIWLTFDVKNSGQGPAKDLVVTLNQSDVFTIPESAGEIVIDELGGGKTTDLGFMITIDPDADIGINSVPITLGYYDETRVNQYSETKYIGLTVAGKIDFVVTVDSAIGGTSLVTISNRGTGSAEYLTVTATADKVSKEFYIGTLDSDDSETIEIPQPRSVGEYELTLNLDYKDLFNNEYSEDKIVTVRPSFGINYGFVLLLIIIIAASYWYFKKKKKKK
ncbi:MAG: hypothetical protein KJ906_01680 [Nanoarchaeota archaeon]|nr:hypothetical protein [Nanoarchaeota archaeon]